MIRQIGLALTLMVTAAPALAQEFCFCLRCTIGTHRSFSPGTEAMSPTVPRGLCTVSERIFPGAADPQLGDVILYTHQTQGRIEMARVIALPGQTVQMIGGLLHIDATPVTIAPLPPFTIQRRADATGALPTCPAETPDAAPTCDIPQNLETLPNGASYPILNLTEGHRFDDTPLLTVPEDHVFTLGDHRDLARDSRVSLSRGGPGFIGLHLILGTLETPVPYQTAPE